MTMTRDAFMDALRKTKRDWVVDEMGNIRRTGQAGTECPISSVMRRNVNHYTKVGKFIGLSDANICKIAAAADDSPEFPDIRLELLSACGLLKKDEIKDDTRVSGEVQQSTNARLSENNGEPAVKVRSDQLQLSQSGR